MTGVGVHDIKFTKNKKKWEGEKCAALKDGGSLELGQLA